MSQVPVARVERPCVWATPSAFIREGRLLSSHNVREGERMLAAPDITLLVEENDCRRGAFGYVQFQFFVRYFHADGARRR